MGLVIALAALAGLVGAAVWAFKGGGPSIGPFGNFGGGHGDDGSGRKTGL